MNLQDILQKYEAAFIEQLNRHCVAYKLIGSGTVESPMWYQYTGEVRRGETDNDNQIKFRSSQNNDLFFYVPIEEDDMKWFDTGYYHQIYDYFRNKKYNFIMEHHPTVFKEINVTFKLELKPAKGTVLEWLHNDWTALYAVSDSDWQRPADGSDIKLHILGKHDYKVWYLPSVLSFGDYDNSSNVERSNVRMFLKKFKGNKWIRHYHGGHGHEAIWIDILCDDQEIINTLSALQDYPAINDSDVSLMETEMEREAWDSWMRRDFERIVQKKYKADDIDVTDDDKLYEFYNELKKMTNTYVQIESGGNVYIELEKLVDAIDELPEYIKLEYWD